MATHTTASLEKEHPSLTENVESSGSPPSKHADLESSVDPAFEKRTLRLVDRKLLPILAILYSISLIDRVNISNAYVAGMAIDLELTVGARYSIATLIFFVPYIIFELPSNIFVRRVGAARWIGSIVTAWGIVMLGMGFLKKWWELVICRALLGLLEAGFFPACAYLISVWYIRREIQKRMTGFYVLSILVAGFSSALAGGISEMAGLGDLNGWQWIFIILGIVTIVAGVAAFFLVHDFPDKQRFLSPEQTKWVLDRIERDRADSEYDHFTKEKFIAYLLDARLWAYAFLFGASTTTTYAFAYFLPQILVGMGYSSRNAQLLVAPPYAFTTLWAFGFAVISDKYQLRAPLIAFQACMAILGLSLTAFMIGNNPARYAGVFIGIAGASSNVPGVLGYQQNNIAGYSKRAYATALTIGGGGIGGIIAGCVFRSQDAPLYRPGLWVCIGGQLCIIVVCTIMTVHAHIRNKQADAGTIKKPIEGRPNFRYTY